MKAFVEKLKSTPLFRDADERLLADALSEAELRTLAAGEKVDFSGKLGFILSGQVSVFTADVKRRLLLRTIGEGELFGAAALFGDGRPPGRIIVRKDAKLLFFNADTVQRMLQRDGRLAFSYIRFLSGRVGYLSDRITHLTAGSAKRRVAVFIESFGMDEFDLPVSLSALADMLDVGRASLYRALDGMEAAGAVRRAGSHITVLDRQKLLEQD